MFWCASSSGPGTGIESIGVRFSHCPAVGIKTDTLYGIGQNIVLAMQCLHKLCTVLSVRYTDTTHVCASRVCICRPGRCRASWRRQFVGLLASDHFRDVRKWTSSCPRMCRSPRAPFCMSNGRRSCRSRCQSPSGRHLWRQREEVKWVIAAAAASADISFLCPCIIKYFIG